MKKNVSGQKIGAQMCSATDGSAFTSAVTVAVTGDAGTQATGSVSAGACTHEGNGYHTYAPAQAETNYDLIAFTFIGTGAIPATIQVLTSFPQTGDSYAEVTSGAHGLAVIEAQTDDIGAAGAGLSAADDAIIAALAALATQASVDDVESKVDDLEGRLTSARAGYLDNLSAGAAALESTAQGIHAKTTNLPSDPADASVIAGRFDTLDTSVGDVPTNAELATALAAGDDAVLAQVALVKAKTDNLPSDPADQSLIIAATDALVALIGDVPTNAELATALGAADDAVLSAVAGVQSDTNDIQTRIPAALTGAGNMKADALAINGSTDAAANLGRSALAIVRGAAVTGTLSTTQMTTDVVEATNDHFNGRVIIWTTGALAFQASDITDYVGASGLFTFTATTDAPANGDQFVIV